MTWSSDFSGWEMAQGFSAVQSITAETTLFRQDAQPQLAAFTESGWVKIVRLQQDGHEKIIALCPPGSLLGAAELIAERLHTATAVTLTQCHIRAITASEFLSRVRTSPGLAEQILQVVSRQNCASEISLAQSGSVQPNLLAQQLFWRLLRAQNRDGATGKGDWEGTRLLAPVKYQELAQMLGVSPEHFSRMLGRMEKEDILHRNKGWLIFPDPERLWRAPEIESLVESNRRQTSQFTLTDPIYA